MTDISPVPAAAPELLARAFAAGQTFEHFRDSLDPSSPGRVDLEVPVVLAGAELAFRDHSLRVLAIVEDWCKDSRDALPVLAALVAASPASELRIVRRDEHAELMAAYLKDGRYAAIPVFLFLDDDWNELARYVERPLTIGRLRRAEREEIARRDPRFLPVDAKPSAFEEPTRSDLRAAILELRARSRPQVSVLIAAELAAIADRLAGAMDWRSAQTTGDRAPAPQGASWLATGPLQIVSIGDDDCELDPAP